MRRVIILGMACGRLRYEGRVLRYVHGLIVGGEEGKMGGVMIYMWMAKVNRAEFAAVDMPNQV